MSNFSLDFPAIGAAVSGETRSKVDPHYKSYAWVPVLWSFDKLREVGIFSYLFCEAPKPRGPLTTRQPVEYKWMSGYPTPLQKIG